MIIDHDIEFKFLPTLKLIELLSTLQPDTFIWPNRVGNLTIFTREGDAFTMVGMIDFLFEGDLELFNEPSSSEE